MPTDGTPALPEPNHAGLTNHPITQVLALGIAQILAWGSSIYLPAVVSGPVSRSLGLTPGAFFAAFSLSLVVMAAAGPRIGRVIDRRGGRGILCMSNAVLAAGLLLFSLADGVPSLFLAWCVMGLGMGLGLYDAIFAALVHERGKSASRLIVGVSLVGGFASTVGWPLSAWMVEQWEWRTCCQSWALAHLCIGLPIHWRFVRNARAARPSPLADGRDDAGDRRRPKADMACLYVFSGCTAFVTSAMAAHLPGLLLATGSGLSQALLAGMLLGPAQVAARLVEYGLTQHFEVHPLTTARVATALHPAACAVLGLLGAMPFAGALFAMLHGAGNGMISVARGVLPLTLFGPKSYGAITGRLAFFGRSMQALAPFAFALVLERLGAMPALLLSGTVSAAALFALLRLRR